jgi:CheY-like chemotaxis protein/cellulose synthase/poly-beta-1,6-N-acetylglucosamine synthase-like glycosyltransferase
MDKQPIFTPSTILIVDDDPIITTLLARALMKADYEVITASTANEAFERIEEAVPDLVISDVMMPEMDGFEFLRRLRAMKATAFIPVIMLTARTTTEDIIDGTRLGADDYLAKPVDLKVLLAKVQNKLSRPPVPVENLLTDRQTGLHSLQAFESEAAREIFRAHRGGRPGCLAFVEILETSRYCERLGERADREITRQITDLILQVSTPLEIIGRDPAGIFLVLIPETDLDTAQKSLNALSRRLSEHRYRTLGETLHLTPVIGFTIFSKEKNYEEVGEKARVALEYASAQMDLQAKVYSPEARAHAEKKKSLEITGDKKQQPRQSELWRAGVQVATAIFLAFFLPFGIYTFLDKYLMDITPVVYIIIVAALLITAIMIWLEGLAALKPIHPEAAADIQYPKASAIIAAYLPNEAYTILDTLRVFLNLDYPNEIEIILAYNTPHPLPIEVELLELADLNPNLKVMKVEGSESKSQNVNAAITFVTGEFVGIFDADHQPASDSFQRAWQWLSGGYDVVQGHCQVRNFEASWLCRMVAVEFEAIYAVSHPGRTQMYGFGIFGGSNGYWKTDLLRQTRMHGFMLTEDIDSSMRITADGRRIATDPNLISRELAPATIKALWNQRMRWSQGWFQVTREHFFFIIRSRNLSFRQKIGAVYLLAWREVYPWISTQMFPVIAFWAVKYGGLKSIDWLIPVFVMTTLFTLSVGPGQTLLAYTKSVQEIKENKVWFWQYLFFSSIFYTEFKNTISRISQIKELMGERSWRITPRSAEPGK